jgi:uncharacterized protein with FMN-binding domain
MNVSQTAKACVLSLAIVPLVGTSLDFDFGSSRWIMLAAAAIILLPIAILVAKQMVRARREYPVFPAEVTTERISNHLVVLSSAAVLAIYSAGYFKTRSAAERIAARERAAKQLASHAALVVPTPPASIPGPESSAAPPAAAPHDKDASSGMKARRPPAPRSASNGSTSSASAAASADSSARFKDGVYQGRGSCPHGDIVAQVAIRKGQIVYAGIADCLTRYSCSVIHMLPEQIVTRQSTNVDVVSGATESTEAFQDAVADALLKADTQAAARATQPAGQSVNPPSQEQTQ